MITLNSVLRTNAASCILFGLVFILMPASVAAFLSTDNPAPNAVLLILGAVLIFNGLHLAWASFKPMPSWRLVAYFSFGDFLWVFASVLLILLGIWITTPIGIIATVAVAVMVGILGIFQIIKRKRVETAESHD